MLKTKPFNKGESILLITPIEGLSKIIHIRDLTIKGTIKKVVGRVSNRDLAGTSVLTTNHAYTSANRVAKAAPPDANMKVE